MDNKEYSLWNKYGATQKEKSVSLGPHSSYQWKHSRRHLLFTAARYKFAMKMIGNIYNPGENTILDLGCSDGFGTYYVAEFSKFVLGVDFDEEAIIYASLNYKNKSIEFKLDNFLGKYYGKFDGIVSFDVIEHIYPANVDLYMKTISNNLDDGGGSGNRNPKFRNSEVFERKCNRRSC